MAQLTDNQNRQREWQANGNKPCPHPHVSKEYYLGADTGDYVCDQCGAVGSTRDWPEREREAATKSEAEAKK